MHVGREIGSEISFHERIPCVEFFGNKKIGSCGEFLFLVTKITIFCEGMVQATKHLFISENNPNGNNSLLMFLNVKHLVVRFFQYNMIYGLPFFQYNMIRGFPLKVFHCLFYTYLSRIYIICFVNKSSYISLVKGSATM